MPVSYKSVSLSFRKKESWHEDFNHDNRDMRRAVRVTGCCSRIVHLQAGQTETEGTEHQEHGRVAPCWCQTHHTAQDTGLRAFPALSATHTAFGIGEPCLRIRYGQKHVPPCTDKERA